jgi:hypothetical protein
MLDLDASGKDLWPMEDGMGLAERDDALHETVDIAVQVFPAQSIQEISLS